MLSASLRSAANLYGIFGEKETDLSITAKEIFCNRFMNQKGFLNIIVIGIVLAVVFGIGGYFVLVRKPITPDKTQQPVSTLPSDTSITENWKTYENKQYKFRLRYPSDWKTEQKHISTGWDLAPYSETFASPDFRVVDQTNAEIAYDPSPIEKGGRLQLMLTAVSHREAMSFDQYRREREPGAQIREVNALKFLFSKSDYPMNSRTFEARFIYPFSPSDTTYQFSVRLETSESEEKLYEDIFNDMLASFDFVR